MDIAQFYQMVESIDRYGAFSKDIGFPTFIDDIARKLMETGVISPVNISISANDLMQMKGT